MIIWICLERLIKKCLRGKKTRDEANSDASIRRLALCLEGSRQVGKTYLAKKFAEENYNACVYINARLDVDRDLLANFRAQKRMIRGKEFFNSLLALYSHDFSDSPDTIVIIDEIQDSSFFYNSIRDILMNCNFHSYSDGLQSDCHFE
ncbi:MAG: AAA family ATPase [Clostridiales bacterium]|nr:AAA family ATPase [Clostridiales bacterium]